MERIAVLITCHNRREKTLACLRALFACVLPSGYAIDVYLVDDGSTDGTGEQVKSNYPDVNIIQGSGNLYWSGGMRLAWYEAAKNEHDYYLWLNDDTFLFRNAISVLLAGSQQMDSKAVICATVVSPATGKVTYGGKMRNDRHCFIPNGELVECEIINGNCVLVPKFVYERLGLIDKHFTHAIGDWDYGLRAVKCGIKCFIAPEAVGSCEANSNLPNWCRKEVSLMKRLRSLYSPLASAQPIPYFVFVARHFGMLSAVKQFFSMHIRVIFPQLWMKK